MDGLDFYRGCMITATIIILAILLYQFIIAFRDLSVGQKLWATGTIFLLIYTVDVHYESLKNHLEYRWRLIPLTVGIFAFGAYCLEPSRSRRQRYGKSVLAKQDENRSDS